MAEQHTPGPWEVGQYEWDITTADDDEVAQANAACPEWRANARLIAAAPELLRVCLDTLNRLDYLRSVWGDEGITRGLADALRAAVARATGQLAD